MAKQKNMRKYCWNPSFYQQHRVELRSVFLPLLCVAFLSACANGKNKFSSTKKASNPATSEATARPPVLRTLSGSLSLQMGDNLLCVVPATTADEAQVKSEGADPQLLAKKVTTKFFFYSSRSGNVPRSTVAGQLGQASAIYQLRAPDELGVTSRKDMTPSQMAIADQVDDTFSCKIQYTVDGNLVSSPLSEGFKLTATAPENICVGKTVGGVAGTSICLSGAPTGSDPVAGDILAGKSAWKADGSVVNGTLADRGAWNLTGLLSTFPGAGVYSSVSGAPTVGTICAGTTIVGATGTAVCQSGTATGTDPVAGEVLTGKSAWKADGTVLNGTMENRGALDLAASFPGAGYYSSLSAGATNTTLCTGTTIFGTPGSAVCQSTSAGTNAAAGEVLTGKYFWNSAGTSTQGSMANRATWDMTTAFPGAGYVAAVSNAPAAAKVCNDTTFNGALGNAICDGANAFDTAMGSGLHRDKGGTPTQLTISGEKAGADTLASGYREVPDVDKDDEGVTATTNVTKVTRGTTVWDGVVPRVVCGMGIATVANRIIDCNSQHTTKPSWDASAGDGKISWDGAVLGNAAEGSWTLVTVYNPALANGTTCLNDTNCREVWRDDRTGLLWSDRLGDLTSNDNQGDFNWCLASGNTQNAGSLDCRTGVLNSYNKPGISLCAEPGGGIVTPVGVHNAASANDLGAWAEVGTSIRDAKGGMLKTANSDPEGALQSPSVRWRLPTKSDFDQATVNGFSRVLPNFSTGYFWSASVYASNRSIAWIFYADYGFMGYDDRSVAGVVRCVGR